MVLPRNKEPLGGDIESLLESFDSESSNVEYLNPNMITQEEPSDYNPGKKSGPVTRLMSAVLRRSIYDLKGTPIEAKEAIDWFFSLGQFQCDDQHLFSCEQVCECLDIDKKTLLGRVRNIVETKERLKALCFNFSRRS